MADLASMNCVPCRGGVPPAHGEDLQQLHERLGPSWRVVEEHHLEKDYSFDDFAAALDFVDRISAIAEEQGHHPDICFGWGYASVKIYTHKIDGLVESDFILAAKIDQMMA